MAGLLAGIPERLAEGLVHRAVLEARDLKTAWLRIAF
jgi:hypothetical protein